MANAGISTILNKALLMSDGHHPAPREMYERLQIMR